MIEKWYKIQENIHLYSTWKSTLYKYISSLSNEVCLLELLINLLFSLKYKLSSFKNKYFIIIWDILNGDWIYKEKKTKDYFFPLKHFVTVPKPYKEPHIMKLSNIIKFVKLIVTDFNKYISRKYFCWSSQSVKFNTCNF